MKYLLQEIPVLELIWIITKFTKKGEVSSLLSLMAKSSVVQMRKA